MRVIDLTGKKIGRWRVIRRARKNTAQGQARWCVRCTCPAKTKAILPGVVLRGENPKSRSCGCLKSEELTARNFKHGHTTATSVSPTYSSWACMMDRCNNENDPYWKDYGGRGITVCERWYDFRNFLADMGERPAGRYSIGRKNNDKGYYPKNCRWETDFQQANNRRVQKNAKYLTHNGRTQLLTAWAKELNIPAATIHTRLRKGWNHADCLEIKQQ